MSQASTRGRRATSRYLPSDLYEMFPSSFCPMYFIMYRYELVGYSNVLFLSSPTEGR